MAVSDWSTTASSNTSIGGVNIDEGCLPGGINDALREIMAQVKVFSETVAPLESPTFTGTITYTGTNLETVLNAKAPLANPSFTGVAKFGDGSAVAPSIASSTDADTGWYYDGGLWHHAINGVEEAVIEAGTANTSAKTIQKRENADARYVQSAEIPTDLIYNNTIHASYWLDPGILGLAPGTVVDAADLRQVYSASGATFVASDPITGTWKNLKRVGHQGETIWVRVT